MWDELDIEDVVYPPYQDYETKTFAELYPTQDSFVTDLKASGMIEDLNDYKLAILYNLLYGRYANSHLVNSDEEQAKKRLYSIVFMYGPTWQARLNLQSKLRNLSDDELIKGSKAIYNHAYNPSGEPNTATLEEIEYINDQNTTNYKKSKLEAYSSLYELLVTDVTESFIGKFKQLFVKIIIPRPVWPKNSDD